MKRKKVSTERAIGQSSGSVSRTTRHVKVAKGHLERFENNSLPKLVALKGTAKPALSLTLRLRRRLHVTLPLWRVSKADHRTAFTAKHLVR